MPYSRLKHLRFFFVSCVFLFFGVGGCTSIPTSELNKKDSPADGWTTKANAIRSSGGFSDATATNITNTDLLQPRTVFQYAVLSSDNSVKKTSGNAIVGSDGTVVIGGFGAVQVRGLTVAQATTIMEKQFSKIVNGPVTVRLTVAGAIQPVQAIDWTAGQEDGKSNLPLIPNVWQKPVAGQPVAPSPSSTSVFALPANPNAAPTPASSPVQIQPGITVPSKPSPVEDLTKPRELGKTNDKESDKETSKPQNFISDPQIFPPNNQAAIYPQIPTEVKPVTMPIYIVGPPDILQIDSLEGLLTQPVRGPHLIRPDGTIGVGSYGSVYVAGMTLDRVKVAVAQLIHARLDPAKKSLKDVMEGLSVDVLAYNTKVYYVITDRVGFGEIVARFPITGSETVLDAISQLSGLPPEAARHHIWVARRCSEDKKENILPVDWIGISQKGLTDTNYQLLPGDRIYVRADRLITFNYVLSKFLAPIERLFGVTLLASQAVNSIKSGVGP